MFCSFVSSPVSEWQQDCEHFQNLKDMIRLDFEDWTDGQHLSDHEIWNLMTELPTFLTKGGLPKPSRWFAWHEQAHKQLPEFFAARCLLAWYFKDENLKAPEDESSDFKDARGESGGLKLLYRALSFHVHEAAHVILMVTRPCWDFYTEQVSDVKTPQDGLDQVTAWSQTWNKDKHLIEIAKTMYLWRPLKKLLQYQNLEGRLDEDDLATSVFTLAASVLSRRLWSMSRYSTPPECYAGLLSADNGMRQSSMEAMRNDWELLSAAEHSATCSTIVKDLQFLFSGPVRLACSLFEQSQWDSVNICQRGTIVLKAVLMVLPDNKIVEDGHGSVRKECKSHPNMKMSIPRMQSCLMTSNIFSSRDLPHPALLSKEQFLAKWGHRQSKNAKYGHKTFSVRHHMLPEQFSSIMGKKTWTTLSEDQYGRSFAAWHWLRFYKDNFLGRRNVKVAVSQF